MASISVIIPAFNAERYLKKAIESVRIQTFSDWEMIVIVDAASGDGTRKMALAAQSEDSRIRTIENGARGVVANRNLGIEYANAPYLAFLDSDDWWHPSKLFRQLAFMQKHKASLSCSGYYRVSGDGAAIRALVQVPSVISYQDLLHKNSIGCLTAIVDRRVFPQCRFPDLGHEDYALWLGLLRCGKVARGLNEPLAYYRVVKGSLSSNKLRTVAWRWRIFRSQENLSIIKSAYFAASGSWSSMFHRFSNRSRDLTVPRGNIDVV